MNIEDFKVESWINSHESTCKYDLTNTCVGTLSVNELINLDDEPNKIMNDILSLKLSYGKVFGSRRLRENILSLYENAKDENVVITHGAICANSLVFLSLIEPEDEVITYLPIYQQHYSIPQSIGAKVKKLYLKEENGWLPDLEELENTITPKTKLICLNNPNNPTGALIDDNMLKKIAVIAEKYGTYILADEVYRGLNHSGNPFGKSIFDIYKRGISTSSMSKTFSLPGLRLGWITAPKEVTDKINIQRNYHVISVGLINDYLASVALENKDKIVNRNIKICRESLAKLDKWISAQSIISYVKPKSGTTVFLKYNKNIQSSELCEKLQRQTGIMLLPSSTMDLEGYIRVGYAYDIKEVINSLQKLTDLLKQY